MAPGSLKPVIDVSHDELELCCVTYCVTKLLVWNYSGPGSDSDAQTGRNDGNPQYFDFSAVSKSDWL